MTFIRLNANVAIRIKMTPFEKKDPVTPITCGLGT